MEQQKANLERIAEIKSRLTSGTFQESSFDFEAYERTRMERFNNTAGTGGDKNCPICRGKGVIMSDSGELQECDCAIALRNLARINRSGLGELVDRCTFDAYQTPEDWQKKARQTALDYLSDTSGKWFAATGAVGSGKTHLCTAICREFIYAGKEVRYMKWREESGRIKAVTNDNEEYFRLTEPLKQANVLYIDDFFKAGRNGVSDGDINLAFEILNARYNNSGLITLLSSELSLEAILDIDEAVGSRIVERCKGYNLHFSGGNGEKNWRLRKS